MPAHPNFTVVLDPETRADLEHIATAEDRSAGAVTREALRAKIAEAREMGLFVDDNGRVERLVSGRPRYREGSRLDKSHKQAQRRQAKREQQREQRVAKAKAERASVS